MLMLCSSATSEAAANVELHSPTCSAAASFRAVVRYTASVRPTRPACDTTRTRSRVVTRMQWAPSSELTPVTRMMPSETIVWNVWPRPAMKTHHGNPSRDQSVSPGGRLASAVLREAALTSLLSTGFISAMSTALTSSGDASCSVAATGPSLRPGAYLCNAAATP